jgi:hypothetical protein
MTEVFPIGHYMGERHPEGLHYVRVGLEHQTMTEDEFGVWVLSHQDSPQWSSENVLALATQSALPTAQDSVERLLAAGLLVTRSDTFTQSYRLHPLQVGRGNTAEAPDVYEVGLPGQEPAKLSAGSYEVWQWAAMAPTLWHTCEIRGKVTGTTSSEATESVLADLRPLLGNSCAYLDKAR